MTPVCVAAPATPVVPLDELKAHLNVDFSDDDALIVAYEGAAVAHLDAWTGILGRCINEQTWRISLDNAGCVRSPFPDVVSIEVSDESGAPMSDFVTGIDGLGTYVDVAGEGPFRIDFTCAMSDGMRPVIVMAIKLLVAHWYMNREAVVASGQASAPLAFEALINPVRWWSL
ncbi:head-tail connector protein [Frigidibacter sp. MR17.24]|uniref:head-tail connector protein n=1 Tax=Frigidibacter sp. MR17.24 TaxID=3127345 RepID=UPI003012A5AD